MRFVRKEHAWRARLHLSAKDFATRQSRVAPLRPAPYFQRISSFCMLIVFDAELHCRYSQCSQCSPSHRVCSCKSEPATELLLLPVAPAELIDARHVSPVSQGRRSCRPCNHTLWWLSILRVAYRKNCTHRSRGFRTLVLFAASTVMNMACWHTRPMCANQRGVLGTGVAPYQPAATATFSEPMMAVIADN